jgi:hypothetical protein
VTAAEKLASFIAESQAKIRRVGEEFEDPDDDWMSVAFLEGQNDVYVVGMAADMFANDDTKDVLAQWLKFAMQSLKAERYAVLFNVHGLENPSEEDWEAHRNGKRISEFPNAYEMLMLIAGDAEQELCCQARINRDGKTPPTLAEWEIVSQFGGRFANLNERMRAA